jgi:Predicted transcriptional regulators
MPSEPVDPDRPVDPDQPAGPDLPATSYAVLGLLSFGEELSGYDLKMWADWTIRFFYWSPSFSQIYSHLKRLESLGYVRSRTVESASARDRRLYSITEAGLAVMRRWAATAPLDPPVLKHSLLLRVWLGHLADAARLEQLLTEHLDHVRQLAANAEARRQGAARGAWAYPEAALRWAHRYYEAEAALAEALLADLRDLADRPVDPTGHLAGPQAAG